MRHALVLVLVASCGRLGFGTNSLGGDGGPDGVGTESGKPSPVRVVVTTDYSLTGSGPFILPGMPVESATVLVDRGAGALERLLTDAQGAVTLSTEGLAAYHVVHGSSDRWRVYTVATGATGTVSLGATAVAAGGGRVTIVLPSGSGNEFSAHLAEHCQSIFEPFSTPAVSIDYGACDGQVVHVIGFISTDLNNLRYVDAGMVKLAPGMRSQVSGTYAPLLNHSIELTNVPAEAKFVSARILARNQIDLTPLESDSASNQVAVTGPAMTLTTTAGAGGDTVRVVADVGRAGRAVLSTSQQIAPIRFSAAPISAGFDASTLLPAFTSLDFDAKLNLTWVGGGTSGTMIVMQLLTDSFEWDAYLPPTATALAFPVIPADIGFPRTFTVYDVRLLRIDVAGATAVALTPAIDQTWRRWPHDPALFPASGNRMAEARYISGL